MRNEFKNTYIAEIDGNWYAFEGDGYRNQVVSIGNDNPDNGNRWFAKWNRTGIKYVSSPSPNRRAAYKKAHRHGNYCGEWDDFSRM